MSENKDVEYVEIKLPKHIADSIEYDEEAVATVYIAENRDTKETMVINDVDEESSQIIEAVSEIRKGLREQKKSFEYSTQDQDEIGFKGILQRRDPIVIRDSVVPHPYCASSVLKLTEIDEHHHSIVDTKVEDTVGRKYSIKSKYPIVTSEDKENNHGFAISQEEFREECVIAENFLDDVNKTLTFKQILKKVFMDKEGIGWGAFEVIRSLDGKVAKLNHIPAARIKVLKGWKGFVEEHGHGIGDYTYYQPFGEKVGVIAESPIDGSEMFQHYNPTLHGELKVGSQTPDGELVFNLRDRKTGEPLKIAKGGLSPTDLQNIKENAANEILYVPKDTNLSVYYGYSDAIPVLTNIAINSLIKDYQHQFFEHNAVPRYAVVIKGAKVDEQFQQYIHEYFETDIRNKAHKTLIITLSGVGNKNISVDFVKIASDRKEADFLETKKSNRDSILQAAKIPPAVLGISENASLGSGRGDAQHQLWRARFVEPAQGTAEDVINKLLKLGLGLTKVGISFDPYEIRDRVSQSVTLNNYASMGAMTINEVRQEIGLSSIEGGDIAFVRVKNTSLVRVNSLDKVLEQSIDGTSPESSKLGSTDEESDNLLSEEISGEQITARNDIEEMRDVVTQLIQVVESMKSDMSEKDEIIKQLSDKIDEKNRSD